MEALKNFLKSPLVLSIIGLILILASLFDVMGVKLLFFKVKLGFGVIILGIYLIIEAIPGLVEDQS